MTLSQGTRARRCVIHFGLAKTGTTAVQEFFCRNKEALLRDHRLLYPGSDVQHWHLQIMFAAEPEKLVQIQRLAGSRPAAEIIDEVRAGLEREIEQVAPDQILVSSEYLVSMTPAELGAMGTYLRGLADELVLLFYVRDPWSFSTSYLQEMIRNGYIRGEVEPGYAEGNVELIDKVTDSIAGEVIVRPYLAGSGLDTTRDVCAILGIDAAAYDEGPAAARSNPGLARTSAGLLTALNDFWPQFDKHGVFRFDGARDWCVEAIVEAADKRDGLELSRHRAHAILRRSRADLDRIHERYLDGDPAFYRHFDTLYFAPQLDDVVGIERMTRQEIARTLFSAMRELSNRAHNNMVWARHAEAEAAYYRGLVMLNRQDFDQARQNFLRVLDFRPGDAPALEQLAQLDRVADQHPPAVPDAGTAPAARVESGTRGS